MAKRQLKQTKAHQAGRRYYRDTWLPAAKRLAKQLGVSVWGEDGAGLRLKAARQQLKALKAAKKASTTN